MSNTDKSVVAKPGVIATRWWWVRHAPVREDKGCIYGQKDLGCDTSDRVVFEAVGKILPRDAVWISSTLKRTHQTADAIWAAGFPKPSSMPHEKSLAEQHLGEWQVMHRATFLASRPVGSNWFADIDEPAPGGWRGRWRDACPAIPRDAVRPTTSHAACWKASETRRPRSRRRSDACASV